LHCTGAPAGRVDRSTSERVPAADAAGTGPGALRERVIGRFRRNGNRASQRAYRDIADPID
jgi:hypothetical protein